MSLRQVRLADAVEQRWRNGGGTTRELLTWPASAGRGNWQLRVSVADITQDGPFSAFPGLHRAFTVLEGAGVVLDFGDHAAGTATTAGADGPGNMRIDGDAGPTAGLVSLTPGDGALSFDGAAAPGCRLLAGPTRDLNFMVRQDLGRARMARATVGQPWTTSDPWWGLYTHAGARLATDSGDVDLPAGTLAWSDRAAAHPLRLVEGESSWWLDIDIAAHGVSM